MSEELEGITTETAPQEDTGEIETAVDAVESETEQESVDEAPPASDDLEPVAESDTADEAGEDADLQEFPDCIARVLSTERTGGRI